MIGKPCDYFLLSLDKLANELIKFSPINLNSPYFKPVKYDLTLM